MAQIQIDLGRERIGILERARWTSRDRFPRPGRRTDRPGGRPQGDGALVMPMATWADRNQGFRASPVAFR